MPNTLPFLPDPVFLYISENLLILRRSDARLTLSSDSSYRIKATADQNPRRNRGHEHSAPQAALKISNYRCLLVRVHLGLNWYFHDAKSSQPQRYDQHLCRIQLPQPEKHCLSPVESQCNDWAQRLRQVQFIQSAAIIGRNSQRQSYLIDCSRRRA